MSKIDWEEDTECDLGEIQRRKSKISNDGDIYVCLIGSSALGNVEYWVTPKGIPLWPIGEIFTVRNKETVIDKVAGYIKRNTAALGPYSDEHYQTMADEMNNQGLLREDNK